jgi:hypothetical protein
MYSLIWIKKTVNYCELWVRKFYFRFVKYLLPFLFLLIVQFSSAQNADCSRVWMKGKVIDTLNRVNFYNLMVVNKTTNAGVFGKTDGSFGVYVNNNDSIILSSKGYDLIGFRVKADSNCQFICDFALIQKAHELEEVVIRPLKTLQQIKEEREALALRETRTITGIEAFQSPITALYQRFSQAEQSKAKVAELQYMDSKVEVIKEILRLYVVYDIVVLTESQFDDFIVFMNMDEDFLKTASDMELATFIKDKFEHYKTLQPAGQ